MAFVHEFFVGYFDPLDPFVVDVVRLPKSTRTLSREAADRVLHGFVTEITRFVSYDEAGGFVRCEWANSPLYRDETRRYVFELATRERAVVMTEMFEVLYPPAARDSQRQSWESPAED